MFEDFTATDRWTKKAVHCVYQALIVAIATRHADAVDVKFLVDGRTVWVALPHPAWVEYKKRSGKAITDSLAVEIAGHYLKAALQAGEGLGREDVYKRQPSISTVAFSGQPDRRFAPAFFRPILIDCKNNTCTSQVKYEYSSLNVVVPTQQESVHTECAK